jgi:sugar O-acyltransferase (sialic acid O-acetyltransferase NeuD family)
MKTVVIFGAGDIAQVAAYYLMHDGGREVACFTVNCDYISTGTFCDRPVVPFETVDKQYPPSDFDMLVAIGYANVNQIRAVKYQEAKDKGYSLCSYISPLASIASNATIGENCFILEHNTLQPYARIGNNVTLWSGNHVGHHVSIGDHSFISSHVVISGGVSIEESCFVGVNATIRDHVKIGAKCVIGAGSLILGDAEPEGVYIGNATERSRVPSTRLKKI